MDSAPARKEKWTLDQKALDAFLRHLDPDRERAGEKYESLRQKLLTFFRCNNCWHGEDLADEAINRVIRRLDEIRDLRPFIKGVARTVALEYHQKAKQVKETTPADFAELAQSVTGDPEHELEVERRLRCIDSCMPLLQANERELITQWYSYDKHQRIENKKKLAHLRGASAGALRVQAYRARKRLQELVEKCLEKSRTP